MLFILLISTNRYRKLNPMISGSRREGDREKIKKLEREGAKAFYHTHRFTLQKESQEERNGLELYSLFIALLPFIWGPSPYTALAIVAVNYAVIANKQWIELEQRSMKNIGIVVVWGYLSCVVYCTSRLQLSEGFITHKHICTGELLYGRTVPLTIHTYMWYCMHGNCIWLLLKSHKWNNIGVRT